MRTRFAVGFSLCALAAHAAEPMQLLIFSGGKTEADSKRALLSFERLVPLLSRAVVLAPGQPRVVESSKLPGLTAGFWVVTLGTCRAPAKALAAIKAVFPGAYSKPLTGDGGAEACPTLKGETVAALDSTLKVAAGVVNAFSLEETSKDDHDNELSSTTFHFVLVEKATGQVIDLAQTDGGGKGSAGSDGPSGREYETCTGTTSVEKGGIVVSRECKSGRTGCRAQEKSIPSIWTETERVTVSGNTLVVSKAKKNVTAVHDCSSGSDYQGD